jgi:HD superfamily phosphohydrolase YqeK
VSFTEAVGFPGSMGPSHSYYFASIPEKSQNIKAYYTGIFHGYEAQLDNNQLFAYIPKQNSFSIIF